MTGFIILLIVGFIILLIGFYSENNFTSSIGGFLVGVSIGVITNTKESENTPSAIDVYRNKTTLEITYRDSIPVDSVVVFKN